MKRTRPLCGRKCWLKLESRGNGQLRHTQGFPVLDRLKARETYSRPSNMVASQRWVLQVGPSPASLWMLELINVSTSFSWTSWFHWHTGTHHRGRALLAPATTPGLPD